MGLDIGQHRDPTALCVVEVDQRKKGRRTDWHFLVRHLERLPIGTTYPAIAQRLDEIARGIRQKGARTPQLFVDATGLGQPLIDLLDDETTCIRPITGVYFFHGDQLTREGRRIHLGKAYLVSRLQVLLQTGRLHLPRTADCEQLAQELLDYEIQVDEKANERYGAFRVGSRDDQVTALGLAVHNEPHLPGVY